MGRRGNKNRKNIRKTTSKSRRVEGNGKRVTSQAKYKEFQGNHVWQIRMYILFLTDLQLVLSN